MTNFICHYKSMWLANKNAKKTDTDVKLPIAMIVFTGSVSYR